ncbi:MAG: rubrerythrin family protein [Firmicutes bacterium]|nr:rubrerythrin family protein [Bacillota bacterium]
MSLKGTRTEKNILTAFAGESQARNRYTFYASQAKKEGFVEIAELFEETANQEKEHAKRLFKFLEGGEVEIQAGFPAGKIGNTAENLEAAAAGENFEWTKMYPEYAKIAREEGFEDVAKAMEAIAVSEKNHERRFKERLANIQAGTVFKKAESIKWICRNCGYVHEGSSAPEVCPACAHPQGFFAPLEKTCGC